MSELKDVEADLPPSFGRYRMVGKLGRGGMGTVYLARDTDLDREVAIKVPKAIFGASPQALKRFRREAMAAAKFRHPNFCPVYDVGQVDGRHFLVMAYIEGETLAALVRRGGPLDQRRAAETIRTLALALAELHLGGIIHRDLKPDNIMISIKGDIIIMDFGLARLSDLAEPSLTGSGIAVGTPYYMSPEQVDVDSGAVGPRSDVYSLGVILYELLCGRRPFNGSLSEVYGQILVAEPTPLSDLRPDLDPALDAIRRKAMAKSPGQRYGSMGELARAIDGYLDSAAPPGDGAGTGTSARGDEGAASPAPGRSGPSARDSRIQPLLRVGVLKSGNATYVNEIENAFLFHLKSELDINKYVLAPSDGNVEWAPNEIPNWSSEVDRLMSRGGREGFHYLVAVGTQAAVALREALGPSFGATPTLFLGVTYPRLSGIVDSELHRVEDRQVAGVRYGCGLDAVASLLHHRIFPGRRLCFVFQKGIPQDETSFRELQTTRLAAEGSLGFIKLQRRLRSSDLSDDDTVYFSWYTFTRLFKDKEFDILKNKLVVSIMQDNVRDGVAVAGVGTDHDWIGRRGAQIVLQHLNSPPDRKPAWGCLGVETSPLLYWLNARTAAERGVEFTRAAVENASEVYG
jgi:serine/threonine protein kinase